MRLCRIMEMTPANAQNATEKELKGRRDVAAATAHLLLDLVGAAEHAVDASKIVGTREESIRVALGSVILLQVSLLAKVAHLHTVLVTCSRTIVRA
jgi:hypothetical protein